MGAFHHTRSSTILFQLAMEWRSNAKQIQRGFTKLRNGQKIEEDMLFYWRKKRPQMISIIIIWFMDLFIWKDINYNFIWILLTWLFVLKRFSSVYEDFGILFVRLITKSKLETCFFVLVKKPFRIPNKVRSKSVRISSIVKTL